MYRKLTGLAAVLVLLCNFGLPVAAAPTQVTAAEECAATAITKIYEYQPLTGGKSGSVMSDSLLCTAEERIWDTKGTYYLLADSTPLHDSSLFSRSAEITSGAGIVRSLTPIDDPENGTRSAFRIILTKEYSGQHEVLAFTNTYTAKEDTVLTVRPTRGGDPVTLTVKKGSVIRANSKLVLDADTIDVTNYTDARLKALSIE